MGKSSDQIDVSLRTLICLRESKADTIRYYKIYQNLYATSLLFAESIMTNSTWTQNHVLSLLALAKRSLLASVLLMDETTDQKAAARGDKVQKKECKVLYPPCDVQSLVGSGLGKRGRGLVSLSQFR